MNNIVIHNSLKTAQNYIMNGNVIQNIVNDSFAISQSAYLLISHLSSQVMANFGMHMSDDQFKELCARLSFYNGHMTYIDFVDNFEDPRHSGKTNCNHKLFNKLINWNDK